MAPNGFSHTWITGAAMGFAAPMSVSAWYPDKPAMEYPLVLVHGGGSQGTDWLQTPDGRPGWAELLVDRGVAVHVIDRPGHGRSRYDETAFGPADPGLPQELLAAIFAPVEPPSGRPHSQFPDDREATLAWLAAAGGPTARDHARAQRVEADRLVNLLERIGPSVLVTHSAGAPCGWLAADSRPDLVVAILAIEPLSPPFSDNFGPGRLAWGLTGAPVTYVPAVSTADQLATADGAEAAAVRSWPRLKNVPVALVTGEASVFAEFGRPTVDFLRMLAVPAEHIELAKYGVSGNGHGLIFEKNNDASLDVALDWLRERLRAGRR